MSQAREVGPPKTAEGRYDQPAIKAMFMASAFLNWTQFAESQGWEPLLTRRELPVRTWIKEKREILTTNQMDILSGLIHERKFKWTSDVIKTLDDYPAAIDRGLNLTMMKMAQLQDMAKDYFDNFRGKPEKMLYKNRRVYHPFEKLPASDFANLMAGIKSITEAKLKALMLDKWAVAKLDLPVEDEGGEEGGTIGPKFLVDGKETLDVKDLQVWMDAYLDKPQAGPQAPPAADTTIMVKADGSDQS